MRAACIIYLPHYSQTLRQVSYLNAVGDTSLFVWSLEWLREHSPVSTYVVAHQNAAALSAIERACRERSVPVVVLQSRGVVKGMQEAVAQIGATNFLLPGFGIPLAPKKALDSLLGISIGKDLDYAWIEGIPDVLGAEIYRSRLIDEIAELPAELRRGSLRATLQSLLAARSVAETELPFPLRMEPLNALRTWGLSVCEIPGSIDIRRPETSRQFEVAAQCSDDSDRLGCLKDLLTRCRRKAYEPRVAARVCRRRTDLPRVLFVSNASAYTGAEESLCEMIGAFGKGRSDLRGIVGLDGYFADRLRDAGVQVTIWGHDFAASPVENTTALYREFHRIRPDVIHFNSGSIGTPALVAAHMLNIPYVLHARVCDPFAFGEAPFAAERTVAVSDFVRSEFLRLDLEPERVVTIYDGIDPERFRPGCVEQAAARDALCLPHTAQIILMIARFVPYKRHDVLLRAAAIMARRLPSAHVVLVGEVFGSDASFELSQRLIAELALKERVTFLPFQTNIRAVEAAANVQVLCSDREPLGTCILESMAMGVPVIITDTGGLKEIVVDGESGFVIKSGDHDALADRLAILLTSVETAQRMGANARRAVLVKADLGTQAQEFERLLHTVARDHRAAPPTTRHAPTAPAGAVEEWTADSVLRP